MSIFSRAKYASLANYLWLIVSNVLLIYSLASTNTKYLYTRLALTALATIMLSLRLSTRLAMLSTFISTSLGLICLRYSPLLPTVSAKKLAAFEKAFSIYQMTVWRYGFVIIGLALLLAYGVSKLAHKEPVDFVQPSTKLRFSTFDLTSMATFVAFGVAINSVRAGYFSFGGFPIILAGLTLGPINGFIVGMLTDLVAFVIRPGGIFSPVYVLTSALTGFLPIYILHLLDASKNRQLTRKEGKNTTQSAIDFRNCKYWQLLFAVGVGQFLTSVLIVSLSRSLFYAEGSFIHFFIMNLSRQIFNVPLYAYLCLGILQSVNPIHLRLRKYRRS